jgi:hypothetical protein
MYWKDDREKQILDNCSIDLLQHAKEYIFNTGNFTLHIVH